MTAPTPIAIYIEAGKVSLPLDGLPDKVPAGFMCPLCKKVHAPSPEREARAAALACCWCEAHGQVKHSGSCMSCLNEDSARWYAKRLADKAEALKAAYAVAKPWDGQDIVPVDWEGPDDVHGHPAELFDKIADSNHPEPVTLDDLPVMAYVAIRKRCFDASEILSEAMNHETIVPNAQVDALQAALDAWSEKYGYDRVVEGEIVRLDAERKAWWAEYIADPCEDFDEEGEKP